MRYFLRSSFLLILLLLPTFADNWLSGFTEPIAVAIGNTFEPLTTATSTVFNNIANAWNWTITIIRLLFTLGLIIGLQFLIIKLWIIIIKSLIKIYVIYQILTAKKSELPDLLELVSQGKKEISDKVRNSIQTGKGRIGSIAKIFTLLS